MAGFQRNSSERRTGPGDNDLIIADRINALSLSASGNPLGIKTVVQTEDDLAVVKQGAKGGQGRVEPKCDSGALVSRVADDFGRGAKAAWSQDKERPDVAVAQGHVAPGDDVIVFDVLPEIGAFGGSHAVRGRGTRFNSRQQTEVLRITEPGAFSQRRGIEGDFHNASFVRLQHGNLERGILVGRRVYDRVVRGRFVNDVAIGDGPWADAAGAVPRPKIGSDFGRGLAGVIGLRGSPAIDVLTLPKGPEAVAIGVDHEKDRVFGRIARA